jgi:predicted DNA-binding protein
MKNTETALSTIIPIELHEELETYLKKTEKKKKVVIRKALEGYLKSSDENRLK